MVVRNFESHGMRALARAVPRIRTTTLVERWGVRGQKSTKFTVSLVFHTLFKRPELKRDQKIEQWRNDNFTKAEREKYGGGGQIFTEGTFVVWEVESPETSFHRIKDYFDEHEEVIKHKFISEFWYRFISCSKI